MNKKTDRIVITLLAMCLLCAMLFIVFSMLFPQNNPQKDIPDPVPDGSVFPDGSDDPVPPDGSDGSELPDGSDAQASKDQARA